MEWLLILTLHTMNPKADMPAASKVIEIRGFSTESDCEAAGEAASAVALAKDGPLGGMTVECKRLD